MTYEDSRPQATREDIGKVLRAFRSKAGWSQKDLQEATNIPFTSISLMESGGRNVGIDDWLAVIATFASYEAFGRALDQFATERTISKRATS